MNGRGVPPVVARVAGTCERGRLRREKLYTVQHLALSVVYHQQLITYFFHYSLPLCARVTFCIYQSIGHFEQFFSRSMPKLSVRLHVPARGGLPLPSGARTYSQIHPKMCLIQADT